MQRTRHPANPSHEMVWWRAVGRLRAVPDVRYRIDFCPNSCGGQHSQGRNGVSTMEKFSRRHFVAGAVGAVTSVSLPMRAWAKDSPFRVSVINDEISPDFDHACSVASHDFGMSWIELRSMWGKNVMALSDAEIGESKRILAKYNLQVTDIASPLGKTDWPGAPRSPYGSKGDMHGADEVAFKHQEDLLERSISLAKPFNTG